MPFKNYIKSLFFARNTIKTHPYTQKVIIYQIEVVWGQQEVLEKNMTYAYYQLFACMTAEGMLKITNTFSP